MVAKFNSKIHLFKTVLRFFQPFRSHLPSKFANSANMIEKNNFKIAIWVSKNAELDTDFESIEKDEKNSCDRKMEFLTFIAVCKSFRPSTFG
jgi:hypothetical protein